MRQTIILADLIAKKESQLRNIAESVLKELEMKDVPYEN